MNPLSQGAGGLGGRQATVAVMGLLHCLPVDH